MNRFRLCGMLSFVFLFALTATGQQQELKILSATPKDRLASVEQAHAITVAFNQPMVPLAAVASQRGDGIISMVPSFPGKFRWMGTSTLSFIHDRPLPRATFFTVTVPAGTRSFAGNALSADYVWTFETPRPAVTHTVPGDKANHIKLDQQILIHFNQPVDPGSASKYISIVQIAGGQLIYPEYSCQHPQKDFKGEDSLSTILLTLSHPLSKAAHVEVVCRAGLQAIEGLLPLEKDFRFWFDTYGDLRFEGVTSPCEFRPECQIVFSFSNGVTPRDLLSHLRFDPPLQFKADSSTEYHESISFPLPLKPETSYRGVITPGLKDVYGGTLAADASFSFHITSYRRSVNMTTGAGLLEARETHAVPVVFMNVDSVGVQMGQIKPDSIVEAMKRLDFEEQGRVAFRDGFFFNPEATSESARRFSRSTTWPVRTPQNVRTVLPLSLDPVIAPASNGFVFLQLDDMEKRRDKSKRFLKTIVQITNLGITAKFSPDSTLVWVTHLNDATPVAGASVEILSDSSRITWRGRTDSAGTVTAPGWGKLGIRNHVVSSGGDEEDEYSEVEQPMQWVLVKKDGDAAFSNSRWNKGIQPWEFGIEADWNPQPENYEGTLFSDRGLYKAGETVEIKGIVRVRKDGGWHVPRNMPVRLQATNSRGEKFFSCSPKLSSFGSFSVSIPLKSSAPLGQYNMVLQLAPTKKDSTRDEVIAYGSFRVEAFRPLEFEVSGTTQQREYVIGDTAVMFLEGRYLFGAPMVNEKVQWRVSTRPSFWSPPGYDGYYFSPIEWLSRYGRGSGYEVLSTDQGNLDAQGRLTVRVPLRVGELRGPSTLMVEGDVTSETRQTLSGRATTKILGGEYAVGIRPSTTFLDRDSLLRYDIIAVDRNGTPVRSRQVNIQVFRRTWYSVCKAEEGGRYKWEWTTKDSTLDSLVVTTDSIPVRRVFTPRETGEFFISAESADPRGNILLSQSWFYVHGSGYVPWERSDDDRIEIVADKQHYAPGDVAHLMVKSPYESTQALVTLEREGIIRHFTTTLVGSTPTIDIPITSSLVPNFFVSVVLLQGRTARPHPGDASDIGRPSFKIAYASVSVSPAERALHISLSQMKEDYRPGDSVSVAIQVQNAEKKGVKSEVTLSVADLGVLNLVNYRIPNPFDLFYRERPLSVTTTDSRLNLVQQRNYGEKGEDDGGGGAAGPGISDVDADGLRREFRASACWCAAVLTDSTGMATVRFKLPDNITAFNAMAVAQTVDSKFGYGERQFTVSKPILLQSSLPRFARVGDTFVGGVALVNHSTETRDVSLSAHAKGIRMADCDTTIRALAPGEAREIRFRFTAERIGKATLTVRATSRDDTDGLLWTLPIQAPRLRETVALWESTTDEKVEEQVIPPDSVYRDIGGVEVTGASTAMSGLSGGISYLFSYPYGCLEQRCSAILPIILAKDLVAAFHLDILKGKDEQAIAQATLDELALFQRGNGGFALWKNTEDTRPFLTAYALFTLVQARRNGYAVDGIMIEKAMGYLHRVLTGDEKYTNYNSGESTCSKALILYTLALAGKPEHSYMTSLFEQRSSLPPFAVAYLLKALHTANDKSTMQEQLSNILMNCAKIAPTTVHFEDPGNGGYYWVFGSVTRTTALVLQAMAETQPQNQLIPKTVRWLLEQQKAGHWRTTQENWFVVDALATYLRAYENEEPDFRATITVAGKQVIDEMFKGRSLNTVTASIPMSDLSPGTALPVSIAKNGTGRFYYGVRINYYPKAETTPKEEGFEIAKSIAVGDSLHAEGEPFRPGTLVKVTLLVSSSQYRHFVVIDDPLPAGFEIVNSGFETNPENQEEEESSDSEWLFNHIERKDDRVLVFSDYMPPGAHMITYLARVIRPGVYQMPATRVEGMYEPEVFGQTGSSKVTVR